MNLLCLAWRSCFVQPRLSISKLILKTNQRYDLFMFMVRHLISYLIVTEGHSVSVCDNGGPVHGDVRRVELR